MAMISLGLGVIPLLWAILTVSSVLFCYFYAISVGHLYPFVPSISNTGAREPEGNVFAEAMNISSCVCALVMAFRYFQLDYRAGTFSAKLQHFNMFSLVAGIISNFGISLIANFPSNVKEEAPSTIHDFGAVLSFVTASCYCVSQTFLTWKLFSLGIDDRFSWVYRLILSCVMFVAGSFFLISSLFAYQEFRDSHSKHDMLEWEPGDSGYHLHVVSNVCEWIGASSFVLFILSYFNEFQDINIVTKCSSRYQEQELESLTKNDEYESP